MPIRLTGARAPSTANARMFTERLQREAELEATIARTDALFKGLR
jgi:hypothetical protein